MTALTDIILPHKERFTLNNAGAVSTVSRDLASLGSHPHEFRIFGTTVDTPLLGEQFHGLTAKSSWFRSQTRQFVTAYLRFLSDAKTQPDLIEVHGRLEVAKWIAEARPDIPVCLYLHNDPRSMKGGKTPQERAILADRLRGVISVSHYIENCFFDGIDAKRETLPHLVNWLGVNRTLTSKPQRKPFILMAGRMVPEKGFYEAGQALVNILPHYPDWSLKLAGGKSFASGALSSFEKQLHKLLSPLGKQAELLGHIPVSEVRRLQQEAEICAVPSLWQEPGGTAVLEAMAAGSALITTNRGGLPEVAEGRAIILSDVSVTGFEAAFVDLISDDKARKALQQKVWDDYPFSGQIMADQAAQFRLTLIGK